MALPDGTYYVYQGTHFTVSIDYGYFVSVWPKDYGPAPFVGYWTAPDGEIFVDDTTWIEDKDKAIELGNKYEQFAIWDCANNQSIELQEKK